LLSIFEAVILGIVQGMGEFLPISSSAHLVLVPWLMGWYYAGLTFDVALHMGTLIAVVAYFWKDWLKLIKAGFFKRPSTESNLFWYLVVATIPGAVIGYLFEQQAETIFREPLLIGIMLILLGVVLYLADKLTPSKKLLEEVRLGDSLLIGISQALALIPGVSRAGATMTAGRLLGLNREAAARFSFLMSTPIIFGAGVMQLRHLTLEDINTSFLNSFLYFWGTVEFVIDFPL